MNPAAKYLRVNGRLTQLPPKSAYALHGIELKEVPRVTKVELVRCLAALHPGTFFLDEPQIAKCFGVRMPPLVLRLTEWNHLSAGEKPSDNETFRMLAEVIADGDVSRFRPTKRPNTDWRNWEGAGRYV